MRKHDALSVTSKAITALTLCIHLSFSLSGCGGGTRGTGGTEGFEVNGKIYDVTGTPISGANITVEGESGNEITSATSDETGSFSISNFADQHALVTVKQGNQPPRTVAISLATANQSAYLEMREQAPGLACVDSVLESDSGALATTRITVWGNLASSDGTSKNFSYSSQEQIAIAETETFSPTTIDSEIGEGSSSPMTDLILDTGSDFVTLIVVRDALGNEHDLLLNFTQKGEREFNARVYALRSEVENTATDASRLVALGDGVDLRFNQDGTRSNPVGPFDNDDLLTIRWRGIEQASSIGLNLNNFTELKGAMTIQCINIEQ
jgi:hypothetical protein